MAAKVGGGELSGMSGWGGGASKGTRGAVAAVPHVDPEKKRKVPGAEDLGDPNPDCRSTAVSLKGQNLGRRFGKAAKRSSNFITSTSVTPGGA